MFKKRFEWDRWPICDRERWLDKVDRSASAEINRVLLRHDRYAREQFRLYKNMIERLKSRVEVLERELITKGDPNGQAS